jgi:hypothetical protein
MEFLVTKMILDLRSQHVHAEDLLEIMEWLQSDAFDAHVSELMSKLGCSQPAAAKAAIAAKLMTKMRPLREQLTPITFNTVVKLARDFTSWLLDFKEIEDAKLVLAYYYDWHTGDLERRPGKYTEHHYEIFSDDEDLDYEDDDSALADES